MTNDGGAADTLRRFEFLKKVQQARANVIVAELGLIYATKTAAAGGCTAEEIASAIRMIERTAAIR